MSEFELSRETTRNKVRGDAGQIVQVGSIQGGLVMGQLPATLDLPVPQMLPPDSPHFIGRRAEQLVLDDLLAGGAASQAVVISAVAGTAGLGKTALAVHWAHGARDRFPDGQLYIDLRGHDSEARISTGEALDRVLRALRVPGRHIPQSIDEKAELYRSLLSGKRVLIVLDNADSADQVRRLLPSSPTCMALVTSRSRLSGLVARDGARRINLGLLSQAESVSLLKMIIGDERCSQEPLVVAELAKRCGYLPLALRIAGERAAARPHLPLKYLIAELADEQRRLDVLAIEEDQSMVVRTVFSWSYQLLQDDVALAFRRLGLHPGSDFDVHVAVALVGRAPEQVRPMLNVLASVHLIEEVGYERFAFHDLLRIYAREMAEQNDSSEEIRYSIDRMFAWYLHTLRAVSIVLSPHTAKWTITGHPLKQGGMRFSTVRDALEWGDRESSNLLAALRFAADSHNHSAASQLPIVAGGYLLVRSRWSDLTDSLYIGVAAAREIKDLKAEAWNLILLDVVHFSLEHFDKALRTSIRALRIARELPDRWCEGAALHDVGMAFDGLGRLDEAIDHLRWALDIYRAIDDRRGEGTVLGLLGDVLRRRQDFDGAEVYSLQGLSIHRSTKNVLGEAYALRQISRLYADTGRFHDAIESLNSAAQFFGQLQYRYECARVLQELGSVEFDIGRRSEAREHWKKALVILQELKHSQAKVLQTRLDSLGGV